MSAYFSRLASSFLSDSNNHIAGALSAGVAQAGFFSTPKVKKTQ
jgi:hypothetical protein